ncbi:hypothetical protein NR798_34105 [Archangium gephyra]|uniref:hypothetical protein n=1 Tax=Archangium gephyra TaxID=48 RepID=UPI0035D48E5C
MSTRLLASGSLVLLLAACATPSATTSAASEGRAPDSSQVSPPAPPAEKDDSLGLEQYVALGVPSPERSWSGQDYAAAAQALSALAQKSPPELPRYQSTRSGPLFARLTSFENVDAIERLQVAPLARVQLAGSMMEPASQLLMLYIGANAASGGFSTEMIELQAFVTHAAAEMMEAIDQVPPTDIRNREAFESGMAQIRMGLGKVAIGALTTVSERKVYSNEDRLRFLGTLKQDLPRLLPKLEPLTQQEVPVRIEKLLADEPSPEVKRELEALRSALTAPAH